MLRLTARSVSGRGPREHGDFSGLPAREERPTRARDQQHGAQVIDLPAALATQILERGEVVLDADSLESAGFPRDGDHARYGSMPIERHAERPATERPRFSAVG